MADQQTPYIASHQFSYERTNPYHNIESTTVADDEWNSFQPRHSLQQAPVGISQYSASPIYAPTHLGEDRSHGTALSAETILKIAELKRLVNKYPQFHTIDADEIVKWAIYCSSNRDNKFLDDMLEQLRTLDNLAKH